MNKRYIGTDVLSAAKDRIRYIFDRFPRIYLSGPSGKDSGVMMHLVCQEARSRGVKVGVLYIDLEAQYEATITWVSEMFALYADVIDPYWICLPIALRNAVSQFAPKWCAWDPTSCVQWVRQPPQNAIVNSEQFPWFRWPAHGNRSGETAMEFEEFTPAFAKWFADGQLTACFVGIRAVESLNRWRSVTSGKVARFVDPVTRERPTWTSYKGGTVYNAYPLYDWSTEDIWRYYGKTKLPYSKTYDLMHRAGLSVHQMRICQPYGDDQRKGLWLYHLLEPVSWGRLVCRVSGANQGALYAQERGSILGNFTVSKPEAYTWQEYAQVLLKSLPPKTRQHMENKITMFVRWWSLKGYSNGIPDEASPKDEASKKAPSWRRVVKMLLKNDYWAKSLSFGPTKSESFAKYQKIMEKRRARWGSLW